MTTIAWDGKELAGDRMTVMCGMEVPGRKVFKVRAPDGRRYLVGFSGDYTLAIAWLRWMEGGDPPPGDNDPHALAVLVIDEQHRMWSADLRRVYTRIDYPRWAFGSGADYAQAAMACGRSASEAVRVACRLDHGSGMGVQAVRF